MKLEELGQTLCGGRKALLEEGPTLAQSPVSGGTAVTSIGAEPPSPQPGRQPQKPRHIHRLGARVWIDAGGLAQDRAAQRFEA